MITKAVGEYLWMLGFTNYEIRQFSNATDPAGKDQPIVDLADMNRPVWQTMIAQRYRLLQSIDDQHFRETGNRYRRPQLDRIVDMWYAGGNTSPWDWMKIAYKPPKRADFLAIGNKARADALERTKRIRRAMLQ